MIKYISKIFLIKKFIFFWTLDIIIVLLYKNYTIWMLSKLYNQKKKNSSSIISTPHIYIFMKYYFWLQRCCNFIFGYSFNAVKFGNK